ncbi:MAG: NADH dehydrogenase subunit E [Methanobacterium sp. PtaB.Bin024]|jgi:NADH-quinone oxidoreductase subunit E|nr:MAG: NADH dehydrogenase subunit E [Methanobacterium sp. PtaB.Bin024]
MEKGLSEILSSHQGTKSDLIPILQDIQSNLGYLPEEMMKDVSLFTRVPESEIYGVATFYSQFRFTPRGKNHIMVCTGTACHVKGADNIIDGIKRHLDMPDEGVTPDGEYSMESVGCLGCCALAPCATVNDNIKSNITLKDIKKIFRRRK